MGNPDAPTVKMTSADTMKAWFDLVIKALGLVALLGGFIWLIARYPDRTEFETTIGTFEEKTDNVEENIHQLQLEQVKVKASVHEIQASSKRQEADLRSIEAKLDRMLEKRYPKR